ncbi:class 1 fructose-bisphosphatase [bacterium]|nr:class 1 fructose-bisphosphatase [candidate division CSSED10-310 bacterium]
MDKTIMSLERHFLDQQRRYPEARGDFTKLLTEVAFAAKIVSREVNRAGLAGILGRAGQTNVQGEDVQKLDILAHNIMVRSLNHLGLLCALSSEESEGMVRIPDEYPVGNYALNMDPLDGSSNIDVNVSIGTIFSILRKVSYAPRGDVTDCVQPGYKQVAAGYVLYGSSTMLVYTSGQGVFGFTLEPSIGEFLLSHSHIRIPRSGNYYSINEAYSHRWKEEVRDYLACAKRSRESGGRGMGLRYIGSLVADFHRNMLKGGIFLYPADKQNSHGKLRYLYEAAPLAFIAEQAGGKATNGDQDIMKIVPTELHQRTPLIIGSADEVDFAMRFFRQNQTHAECA